MSMPSQSRYELDDEGWIDCHIIICSNMDMDHVPGSTPFKAICGCPVWVAPTGAAAVMDRRQATEVVCWNHAPSKAINDLFSNRKTPTLKGARQELNRTLGWQEGETLARRFNFGKEH